MLSPVTDILGLLQIFQADVVAVGELEWQKALAKVHKEASKHRGHPVPEAFTQNVNGHALHRTAQTILCNALELQTRLVVDWVADVGGGAADKGLSRQGAFALADKAQHKLGKPDERAG